MYNINVGKIMNKKKFINLTLKICLIILSLILSAKNIGDLKMTYWLMVSIYWIINLIDSLGL